MATLIWLGADMLIGNYSVLSKTPGRWIGGGAIGQGMNRGDFNKTSMARAVFTNANWDKLSGLPDGYRPPYAWMLPLLAGGLSSRGNISGQGSATISMAGGLNAEAALSGAGDMSATGALIVSLVASLSGSGDITNASAIAFLNLAASLAGSGDLSGAVTAIAHAAAEVAGSGDVNSTISALGTLAATIVVTGTGLTTSNVGAAVWAALAASNNVAGTMGEKLNDAGSAQNPWTEALPGAYVAGTAGYIVGNILDLIGERLVEGGLSQDEVSRIMLAALAGKREGLGTATEQYMAQDGTTPRITLTGFDASGNGTPAVDGS